MFEANLPMHPSVHAIGDGIALFMTGRLEEAWPFYEFRWLQSAFLAVRPNFCRPAWSGQELRGRTILLNSEQGLGDFIQFIRYAPMVKALGATVVVLVPRSLRKLASAVDGVDCVVGPDEPAPHFDFYSHVLSLPNVFATDLSSIPTGIPYVHAESARMDRLASGLVATDELRNVGLVWAGSPTHERDRHRSIPLEMLSPLGEVEGIRFISLQKGTREGDATTWAGRWLTLSTGS